MKPKQADTPSPATDTSDLPTQPIDLEESVAGEEDPGASVDITIDPPDTPANAQPPRTTR
jgi:hypothetical protein